jgi:hypothetical protein
VEYEEGDVDCMRGIGPGHGGRTGELLPANGDEEMS